MTHQNAITTLLRQILRRYAQKNSYYSDYSSRGFRDQRIKVTFDAASFAAIAEAGKLSVTGQGIVHYYARWYYASSDDEGEVASKTKTEFSLAAYPDAESLTLALSSQENISFFLGTYSAQKGKGSIRWEAQVGAGFSVWCNDPMLLKSELQSVIQNYPVLSFQMLHLEEIERVVT